jgi:predicted DNA-binding transcriptional regulator AlpA
VSQATVYRWTQLKDDPLPSQKVIGVRRISLSVADEWFSRREEGNL